ncbi:MAG: glycogen debranching N-terminal domain-containing protein, partial [Microbacteriaceae bacterium]
MTTPRQPLLHDEVVVLRAPTQAWSSANGQMGEAPIHGLYFSDIRLVSSLTITVDGQVAEPIATVPGGADTCTFVSLLRSHDLTPDPRLRLDHTRSASSTGCSETLTLRSGLSHDVILDVSATLVADLSEIDRIKAGLSATGAGPTVTTHPPAAHTLVTQAHTALWEGDGLTARLEAPDASIGVDGNEIELRWQIRLAAGSEQSVSWTIHAHDASAVARGDDSEIPWSVPVVTGDDRLARWVNRSLSDLDALRMTTVAHPDLSFIAAGAPWFFTLFGRDSIWAARFMLPLGTDLAFDTLRLLAAFQGSEVVTDRAEEPGKILHELRRGVVYLDDGSYLPPLYFGTVDATPLWVCLLHDAWRWGLPDESVKSLVPELQAALGWLRDHADADGDGLLEYVDRSGHGLANQGWKDSGDAVQWNDGTLAEGPIALCEVQAYAYEAALGGAAILEHFGENADEWRQWAAALKAEFRRTFWVHDERGPFPAIALDAAKRPVDSLTSNIGHLLGTGILDAEEEKLIASRLVSSELSSGFGVRTLSSDAAGYWPLSYHGGSVWTHDTAIAIAG